MKHHFKVLPLSLFIVFNAYTQQPDDKISLSVGDPAPAISVATWLRGNPVTQFKTGTVYVVEFGATWCTPCIAAIPKLSLLSKKYTSVEIMSVFVMEKNGNVSGVKKFMDKHDKEIQYKIAVDDKERSMENKWIRAAGKNGVPYAFVIDKDGKIAWIGSDTNKLDSMVAVVLSPNYSLSNVTKPLKGKQSNPGVFDPEKLFLIDGNGGSENDFAFRSVVSMYDGKLKAPNSDYVTSFRFGKSSEYQHYRDRVQMIGVSLGELYYAAFGDTLSNQVYARNMRDEYPDTVSNPYHTSSYGKWWHLPVLEVADSSSFKITRRSPANKFNYSLKVPTGLGSARFLQAAMQRDLMTYFGFDVRVETRVMPYWKLVVIDTEKAQALRSKQTQFLMVDNDSTFQFQGAETRDIIWMLGSYLGYGTHDYGRLPKKEQGSFIDQTGIQDKIDFTFFPKAGLHEIRLYLQSVGLDLVRARKPMKIVIIRDASTNN
jgi:thiol-disulfide isomerase/thioredoxin